MTSQTPNTGQDRYSAWMVRLTLALVIVTAFLVIVTAFYACETRRLTNLTHDILQSESDRWLMETRPFLEVRFIGWGEENRSPEFDILNVGKWAAVRVRFDGRDLSWSNAVINRQGSTTIWPMGDPAQFNIPKYERPTSGASIEFRIRYNDVSDTREFADKWRLETEDGKTYLLKVNSTVLKKTPPTSEEYIIQQGIQQELLR